MNLSNAISQHDLWLADSLQHQNLRQLIREENKSLLAEQAPKTKAFSKVSSTEASRLLCTLQLLEVDGHAVDEIDSQASSAPYCDSFDYSIYPDENAGTPALMQHHETQLRKFGVQFGHSAYQAYDLHSENKCLAISAYGQSYVGGFDGGIAPYGLFKSSAALRSIVAYEHKQSQEQKNAYREKHPEVPQVCFFHHCT